ncbi:hypothetical protein PUN28_018528 [Cardiocondyla obscurior]|uniref:Uncharacterized protein n=1 Tax=Cardiocondyla obscurior TaxID=286306 RepID=A0AAW2EJP8_9HYME
MLEETPERTNVSTVQHYQALPAPSSLAHPSDEPSRLHVTRLTDSKKNLELGPREEGIARFPIFIIRSLLLSSLSITIDVTTDNKVIRSLTLTCDVNNCHDLGEQYGMGWHFHVICNLDPQIVDMTAMLKKQHTDDVFRNPCVINMC